MELDELKTAWTQYNVNLEKNLKLNEEILREIKLGKAKSEMKTPINSELFNAITVFFLLAFLIPTLHKYVIGSTLFVADIIAILVLISSLIVSIINVKKFLNVKFYDTPVIELQKQVFKLRRYYKLYYIYTLPLAFILFFSLAPIAVDVVKNVNLLDHLKFYLPTLIFALIVGILMSYLIYKYWYDKKFQNAENFLKEIEEFEKER